MSAFVRTFSRLNPSAHSRIAVKSSLSCGGTSGTEPTITSPVPPLIVIVSPSFSSCPGSRAVFAFTSTCSASQPVTHGVPIPRATTAACEVSPPWAVRIPFACTIPWKSSGVVSQRTRITLSPALPRSSAVSASKTIVPDAAPGEALRPFATTVTSAAGSIIGWRSWSSCAGSIRATASSFEISPSSTISTAARSAAAAVRFAERVWRR